MGALIAVGPVFGFVAAFKTKIAGGTRPPIIKMIFGGTEMKNVVLGFAALVAVSGAAVAADMPVKAGPAQIACAGARWQGAYVGVHGGTAYHSAHRQDQALAVVPGGSDEGNVPTYLGAAVGGQIGYNWTSCNSFWGVEVDGAWTSAHKFRNTVPGGVGVFGGIDSKLLGVATARTRAGVIVDKLMLYVTGGAAALDTKTVYSVSIAGLGGASATVDAWRFGWVAGVGAEWAWTDRISVRSEVLYIGTTDKQYTQTTTATGVFAPTPGFFNHSDSVVLSRVGLNWKL
jgi:outer membrane immunogenic protein